MSDQIDLNVWIQDPENAKAYREWRDSPIGQIVIEGLRCEAMPSMSPKPTAEEALTANGFASGRALHQFRLEHLDDIGEVMTEPDVSYGIGQYLIDVEGYTEKEARTMMANSGGM